MIALDTAIGQVLENRHLILLKALDALVTTLTPQFETTQMRSSLAQVDEEWDNIHALFELLINAPTCPLPTLQRFFANLLDYLEKRGLAQDGVRWGMSLFTRLAESDGNISLRLVNALASMLDMAGDFEGALQFYQLIINAQGEDAPLSAQASVYSNIATVYMRMNKVEEAMEYNTRALTLERQLDDRMGVATSLVTRANILYRRLTLDDMAEALRLGQEAVEMVRGTDNLFLQAQFTTSLAMFMVGNFQFDEAAPVYEEAIQRLAEVQAEIGLAQACFNYALLCRVLKRHDDSRRLARAALDTYRRYDLPDARRVEEMLNKWSV
jgi:tetratricopeptide (TPR) repeat protein